MYLSNKNGYSTNHSVSAEELTNLFESAVEEALEDYF